MSSISRFWLGLVVAGVGSAFATGCSHVHSDVYALSDTPDSPGLFGSLTRPDAVRLGRGQLALEYSPDLDRVTFFGVRGGPNLLHTVGLEREPAEDGSYTFFGGGYTWVAPQRGEQGWRGDSGELQEWPPDPAMDAGPSSVVGRTPHGVVVVNPEAGDGLVQRKRISLSAVHEATIEYELINESDEELRRAHWINTAVSPESFIALRMREGEEAAQLYSDSPEALERVLARLGPVGEDGWALLNLSKLDLADGVKVYTDGPAEIAIWMKNPDWLKEKGLWLHRSLSEPLSIEQRSELRAIGEGPVAVYLNPDMELFEAELYGPVVDIEPGGSSTSTEFWRVYEAPEPLTHFLRDRYLLRAEPLGILERR